MNQRRNSTQFDDGISQGYQRSERQLTGARSGGQYGNSDNMRGMRQYSAGGNAYSMDRGGRMPSENRTGRAGGMTAGARSWGMESDDMEEDDDDTMVMDAQMADRWTRMMKNEDGTHGAHWTREQAKQLMTQCGINCDENEFFAILNSVYSDYAAVAKKYNIDRPAFYADLTKAWIEDKDAVPNKAAAYFKHVVKH